MNEKVFKTVGFAGVGNIVLGVTILVTGVAAGVLLLISGAKLIKSQKDVMI